MFNCHCATVYHVKLVTGLMTGIAPMAFMSQETTKAITPNAMNFPSTGFSPCEQPCPQVRRTSDMADNGTTSVRTVATVLMEVIQAGTGALWGIPLQLANRIMVQKMKMARLRLWSGRFISVWMKWKATARPTRPNHTRLRLPEYHQSTIACTTP